MSLIIDFHTHIYPEWVAAKILPAAKRKLKVEVPGTGAPEDLRRMMQAAGVAGSVLLPLAKGREDVSSLNDWVRVRLGRERGADSLWRCASFHAKPGG